MLQYGSSIMQYGGVSKVSLELSIKLDVNRDFTFCHICSPIYKTR